MDKFVEEYAKNKFLYSGGKEKTSSEWNPEERQKEIQEARKEIEAKGWSLVPSKYIEFRNRDENIDFDTKMKQLQSEMQELLHQEEASKKELLNLFKELGYGIG